MEAYTDFASVYDTFMDETPYEEWADWIEKLICEYGISKIREQAGKEQASGRGQEYPARTQAEDRGEESQEADITRTDQSEKERVLLKDRR